MQGTNYNVSILWIERNAQYINLYKDEEKKLKAIIVGIKSG